MVKGSAGGKLISMSCSHYATLLVFSICSGMLHSPHTACKMRNDRFTGHILFFEAQAQIQSEKRRIFVEKKNVLETHSLV